MLSDLFTSPSTSWIPIAFEVGKGVFSLISEAVGASTKKLEELGDRFENLIAVGAAELIEARTASATAAGITNEHRAAALARIRAARVGEAGTTPVTP